MLVATSAYLVGSDHGSPATATAAATATPTPAPGTAAAARSVGGRLPVPPLRPATPATLPPRQPVSIDIPALQVQGDLVGLGLNPDRSLEVPTDYSRVGWYDRGPKPGATNSPPVIIAGHVDNGDGPAVFANLKTLQNGEEVRLTRDDGSVAVFVVYAAAQYPKDRFPDKIVYARRSESEIVLITCTGQFNPEARSYLDNYVVSARLDPSRSSPPA